MRYHQIYVSVSDNVPKTRVHLMQMGVNLLETSGTEYCHDLIQAAEGIAEDHIFICPADLPLLRAELVSDIVREYLRRKEQSLTVGIPLERALEFGVDVTFYENVDGRPLMPCGVSVVDRLRMLTREYLPGSYYVADTPDVAINVNTVSDLKRAEKELHRRSLAHDLIAGRSSPPPWPASLPCRPSPGWPKRPPRICRPRPRPP
jgi:adenosylcobinamide-phosphate guanylyltransferase